MSEKKKPKMAISDFEYQGRESDKYGFKRLFAKLLEEHPELQSSTSSPSSKLTLTTEEMK